VYETEVRVSARCASSAMCPDRGASPLLRTQSRFLNYGRQVFVEISYLFRY